MKNQSSKKSKKIINFTIFVLLIVLLAILIKINYTDAQKKVTLENTIADMTSLNTKSTFSIDKTFLYSTANAVNVETQKPIWNLSIFQYTDIALYISCNGSSKSQNTIKELYIDNVKFDSLNVGTPNLHYKSLFEFGKFNLATDNVITDKLNYEIVEPIKTEARTNTTTNSINEEINSTSNITDDGANISNQASNDIVATNSANLNNTFSNANSNDATSNTANSSNLDSASNTSADSTGNSSNISTVQTVDYTKPQIYSDASNPITLEYINMVKSNYLVSDTENPLVYNGSLLKRAGIDLNSITGNITFKIHIKNLLDESYVANVEIPILLKDTVSGNSIYDGGLTKEITTRTNFSLEK